MTSIGTDTVVTASFTLHNAEGDLVDHSPPERPLVWVFGYGQLLPAVEHALEGAQPGDEKTITLAPTDAYGDHDPDAVQFLDRELFPAEPAPRPGMSVLADFGEGPIALQIRDVRNDRITLDLNHPLAGQTLTWSFRIHRVREATADEVADLIPRLES